MNGEMKDLQEIVNKVNGVENGVNNLIVPLLKDTIADSNRHNHRLFVLAVILSISLLIDFIVSVLIISNQNQKYADFLSQFEFETEVIQELNADDNSVSTINDGINITK